MAPNTRLDSAFPTQGEAVNGSFAGSEASHWMVPSENNNRNQQNYCCKLTHFFFFLKTDSRFTSYSYITKDCTATELHFTANSPRIQSKLRKTEVLTLAQILVTKNKPETQELLHSYFFFNYSFLLVFLILSYGKKLSNSIQSQACCTFIHETIIALRYTQNIYRCNSIHTTRIIHRDKNKLSTSRAPSGQISGNLNKSFLPHHNERHALRIIKPFSLKECYSGKKSFFYNAVQSFRSL